jgi:hypothetical protein
LLNGSVQVLCIKEEFIQMRKEKRMERERKEELRAAKLAKKKGMITPRVNTSAK